MKDGIKKYVIKLNNQPFWVNKDSDDHGRLRDTQSNHVEQALTFDSLADVCIWYAKRASWFRHTSYEIVILKDEKGKWIKHK